MHTAASPMKQYRTIQNDSFNAISWRLYGERYLGEKIMATNPDYMDVLLFEPGIVLDIPEYEAVPQKSVTLPPWYGDK